MPTRTKPSSVKYARSKASRPKRGVSPIAPSKLSPMRLTAMCLLLASFTLLLYSPVGSHPFVNYDDGDYVIHNTHVNQGLSWDTFTWALSATIAANWHPLTWLSHALDCQLYGLDSSGHHWTSAIIHALNAVLLFLLLWLATRATGCSFLVAALFAVHPLNVESVAWVAERKNVLSMLFFLLTLGAYGAYARRPNVRRYLILAGMFALALASKPMVITLPFVLLLLDYWPLCRIEGWTEPSAAFSVEQRPLSRLILEKLPLLLLSAGSAVITVVAQGESVIPQGALPFSVRLVDAMYAYAMYLWKGVWPANLALIYPHPGRTLTAWQIALSAVVLLVLTVVAWRQRVDRPYLMIGWLWFLGTAVPVIGIVQVGVQVIADRYAYLPLIGVFVMVVWWAGELADHFGLPLAPRAACAALALAALSFVTWRQIGYWKSTEEVWTHALAVTKDNSIAEDYLTHTLFDQNRYDEGMAHLRNYARLEPLDPDAHMRVAADDQDHGNFQDAIKEYEIAIRAAAILTKSGLPGLPSKTLAMTYANLSVIYVQLGDSAKAQQEMNQALVTDAPSITEMMNSFAQYIASHPLAGGYVRLGILLEESGHATEAEQAFARARQLDPQVKLPSVSALARER